MDSPEINEFGIFLLFIIASVLFIAIGLGVSTLLGPSRPNAEKLSPYECGETPVGSAWGRFNTRFYVVALLFVLFEAELIFLFPWSVVFADPQLLALYGKQWFWYNGAEIFLFVGLLTVGLAYIWRKGFITWLKPLPAQQFSVKRTKIDALREEVFKAK